MKLLTKIRRLSLADYRLIGEIYYLLYLAKWQIERQPLARIVDWISLNEANPNVAFNREQVRTIKKVSRYTRILSRYVLFDSKCYDKALVVKKILNQRAIPTALHMGVALSDTKTMQAHAWVVYRQWNIIGGEVATKYTTVRTFV